jgi:hypothetical protein
MKRSAFAILVGCSIASVPGETKADVTAGAVKNFIAAQGYDACFTNPADATLAMASPSAFPFVKPTVPANPPVTWWTGGLGCPKQYVVEISVTKASLGANATGMGFAYMIGGRDNKWEKPSNGSAILSAEEIAPECKVLDGPCIKEKMSDRCRRMVFTATVGWKKPGETRFTVYRSTAFSMSYEPSTSSCTLDTPGPGNENYSGLTKLTPQEFAASGIYRVPPVGQTDTYRILLAANLAKEPVGGPGGIWPSWVGGAPTLSNPVVAQYPVGLF